MSCFRCHGHGRLRLGYGTTWCTCPRGEAIRQEAIALIPAPTPRPVRAAEPDPDAYFAWMDGAAQRAHDASEPDVYDVACY